MLADLLGDIDRTGDIFHESIYLLREDYRILGIRPSSHTGRITPRLGDSFFECYPADPIEMRTLCSMTTHANRHALLMRAGDRPVVILFTLFATTRILVAIVPDAPIRRLLNAPAAFADLLQEFYLFLSPASAKRYRPLTQEGHSLLYPWIQQLYRAVNYDRIHPLEPQAELMRAIMRLRYINRLCGCSVDYDFTGLAHVKADESTFDRLVASTFALLVTVHDAAPDRHVRLIATNAHGCGPMASAVFQSTRPDTELTLLQHLAKGAALRGERFEVTHYPSDPHRILVLFALCHKEISEQGIKNPLPSAFPKTGIALPFFIDEDEDSN